MTWKNVKPKIYMKKVVDPQTLSADTNSASVDTQNINSLAFLVQLGAFTFTGSNKLDLKLQHSDDDATFVDVAQENIYEGTAPIVKSCIVAGDANTTQAVEYRGGKRYARLVLDVSGAVSVACAVVAISNMPEFIPPQ